MKKRILCIAVSPQDLDALRSCFLYTPSFEHPVGVALVANGPPVIAEHCDIAIGIAHSCDEADCICQFVRLLRCENPNCKIFLLCKFQLYCQALLAPDIIDMTCITGEADIETLYYLIERYTGNILGNTKIMQEKIHTLSTRERQVLALMGRGMDSKEISYYLKISYNTVSAHRKSLYRKLEVHTIQQLMIVATRYESLLVFKDFKNQLVLQHADMESHPEYFASL